MGSFAAYRVYTFHLSGFVPHELLFGAPLFHGHRIVL